MTGLMQFGSFILSYIWIIAIVLGLALLGAFLYFGRGVIDILKMVGAFFLSPVGQVVAFGLVIYFAMCVGFNWAEGVCDAKSLRLEIARKDQLLADKDKAFKKVLDDVATANEIERKDAVQAAVDAALNQKNEEASNVTPVNPSACLDRDAAGRVRNIR